MKHLAAYLLLTIAGNSSPAEKDIKAVLESVGIEADDERLSSLISELKGKDLQEVCQLFPYGTAIGMLMF
jgi:large subunit ribosomal protein LP2